MRISTGVLLAAMLAVSGCSTWSTSSVDKTTASAVRSKPKDAQSVIITEDDITNRKYEVLGDVTATVRKTTILNADPTEAQVQEQLRKKAAQMGADAVILVRYGTVGIGLNSWGVLEGKGRAVRFVNQLLSDRVCSPDKRMHPLGAGLAARLRFRQRLATDARQLSGAHAQPRLRADSQTGSRPGGAQPEGRRGHQVKPDAEPGRRLSWRALRGSGRCD